MATTDCVGRPLALVVPQHFTDPVPDRTRVRESFVTATPLPPPPHPPPIVAPTNFATQLSALAQPLPLLLLPAAQSIIVNALGPVRGSSVAAAEQCLRHGTDPAHVARHSLKPLP